MQLVIFTDYDNTASLVEATLAEADRRPDCRVAAVYTSATRLVEPKRRLRSWRRRMGARLRGRPTTSARRMAETCRRWGVPLLVVPDGDPNSPQFISDMRSRWNPDVALSYWSLTIFRDPWIEAFTHAVNFHDGVLPDHRGVGATTMEVYEGLATGGFTFHHIDRGIDTGNILAEGKVPIAGRGMEEIIEAKLLAAGERIGEVLDLIEAGDPGREQPEGGGGSYLSMKQYRAMSNVTDPTAIDREELERRIAAFGAVSMPLPGGAGSVTGLARGRGLGWPRLRLADGTVTVNRIGGSPAVLHLGWRAVRGWLPFDRRGPAR